MDEYIRVKKQLFDDLIEFLKDTEKEGNSYASLLMKKHNIES